MTLHQLEIFVVVAKHLNLRAAAEELRISQPSVFKQVGALEREFGIKFHSKGRRGIALTGEGRVFLQDAETILSLTDGIRKKFRRANMSGAGSLTVGGSHNPSANLLPSTLALFEKAQPQVDLTLRTDAKRIVERWVLDGEVEIAVVNNPAKSPDLVMEPLQREPLVAFAPVDHPLAGRNRLTVFDLAHTPLVIRGERGAGLSATEEIIQKIENDGIKLKIAVRCESPEAVKAAVRKNMGLGLLFEGLVTHDAERGDFRILKIQGLSLTGQSFIVYRKDRQLSTHAEVFLGLLRRQIETPRAAPMK
ncbi:MAG: LysR family transcriptional regulator [Deltaproteobacteria bacterium]|nr:LysR family transcriptional regulator [Deltaproteobacteria bacterium]